MTEFSERYKSLNAKQKEAVDTIDGPLLVVAGPGTGKTELLSVRVANILQKTDTLAENILCLTYTESGATAMRERLIGLIGQDAYKVSIQTFHSFGSETINRYGEHFYSGAQFRPADELSSYEVLLELFEHLPYDSPIGSKMNETYTHLSDTKRAIGDLKKSGLSPDEVRQVLDRNLAFANWLQPELHSCFEPRMSKKIYPDVQKLIDHMTLYTEPELVLLDYQPLHLLCALSLQTALELCEQEDSTKPLQRWKLEWCEKRGDAQLTLKDIKRSRKLQAVTDIYQRYLTAMDKRGLYDFDDMILRVVHAMELKDELRYELQERYQYLLVDEFQDTNDAQMRLIWNLTNNPVNAGRPNIMVVGDDDQAIYRFQGANISNMLQFQNLYTDVKLVTLTDNYRSQAEILDVARRTIVQANERLENTHPDMDKRLVPHYKVEKTKLAMARYETESDEYAAIAQRIADEHKKHPKKSQAVIARWHRQLQALVPYLQQHNLPLRYDRQENALDSPPVLQLTLLAQIIDLYAKQAIDQANALLPELLAHPSWGIDAQTLWELSLDAYKSKRDWLSLLANREGKLSEIASWLQSSVQMSLHEPLELMLDHLFGTPDQETKDETGFSSPYLNYFFPSEGLDDQPLNYLSYLSSLRTIREHLREYRPNSPLTLGDFVDFVDMHRELGLTIENRLRFDDDEGAIDLLSAHKAKGLEYDSVSLIGLNDKTWGETSRGRSSLVRFPHNLPLAISGETTDERIRLLYVGMTRARAELWLSSHRLSNGKTALPVSYLVQPELEAEEITTHDPGSELTLARVDWRAGLTSVSEHSREQLLKPLLENYHLSATHLNHFLDVTRGGPEYFLVQNLLRFPQSMSSHAVFGSAIHGTLQRAHQHLSATGTKKPVEDILGDYEQELGKCRLSPGEIEKLSKKGSEVLENYLDKRYDSFSSSQRVEQSFPGNDIVLDGVRLSGVIDLMDIDTENKTIIVTDYKTGHPTTTWQGKTDYEKIKLHHYRQQLMLYKLLVENSRDWRGYRVTSGIVEYVEPLENGDISRLTLEFDKRELTEFSRLIHAVWERIQALDFKLPDNFSANYRGIQAFESYLLTHKH